MAQKLLRPGKFVQAKTARSLSTSTDPTPGILAQYGLGARKFSKSSPVLGLEPEIPGRLIFGCKIIGIIIFYCLKIDNTYFNLLKIMFFFDSPMTLIGLGMKFM